MARLTIQLGKRKATGFKLSAEEAEAMLSAGFRFAEYNPESEVFRLSSPFKTLEIVDKGLLTIEQ